MLRVDTSTVEGVDLSVGLVGHGVADACWNDIEETVLGVVATILEGEVISLGRTVAAEDYLGGLSYCRVVLTGAVPRPFPHLVTVGGSAQLSAVGAGPLAGGRGEVFGRRVVPCPALDGLCPCLRCLEEGAHLTCIDLAEVRNDDFVGGLLCHRIGTADDAADSRADEQAYHL